LQNNRVKKIFIPEGVNFSIKAKDTVFANVIQYNNLDISEKSIYNFTINISTFTESQNHNVYYNRKLYIDEFGKVKNAPECKEGFGSILKIKNETTILKIINSEKFQQYWYLGKDKCDVCSDCEFRYMCVDNRNPILRVDKSCYYQSECNYNPYIAKWKGEDGYKTLNECGVISNETGYSIDKKRLKAINKKTWGQL
jgi:hypothetical protein